MKELKFRAFVKNIDMAKIAGQNGIKPTFMVYFTLKDLIKASKYESDSFDFDILKFDLMTRYVVPQILSEKHPSHLHMFTGLKDSREVEIYEGDIILCRFYCPDCKKSHLGYYSVEYSSETTSFYASEEFVKKHCIVMSGCSELPNPEDIRVLGNIFENDVLLKKISEKRQKFFSRKKTKA